MKKIKYIVSLSLIIVGFIMGITGMVMVYATDSAFHDITTELSDSYTDTANLKQIEITSELPCNIIITSGENLAISGSGIFEDSLAYSFDGQKLNLEYESKNRLENFKIQAITGFTSFKGVESTIIITIPQDITLDEAVITNGVGELKANSISTKKLTFVNGVGETELNNLNVTDETIMTNGVGEFSCNNSSLGRLTLKNGVGELHLEKVTLSGDCKLNNGVGELSLEIIGNRSQYDISVENGIGEVSIDGGKSNLQGGGQSGSIDISNGVGEVDIDFTEH